MKQRKGEPKGDSRAAEPRTSAENTSGARSAADDEPAAKKPKYEFKILPVDPKNNFDFEDVADK